MGQKIDEILDNCLEEIKKGRSIEECLSQYFQFSKQLEPLLMLTSEIEKLPKPQITHGKLLSTLVRAGEILAEKEKYKQSYWKRFIVLRPVMIYAVAVVLLLIIGWSTIKVSAYSGPGNILYPIKLITEKVKYLLTFNTEGKIDLHITFANERLKELVSNLQRVGELDKKILNVILDESKMALNTTSILPQEKSYMYLNKISQFNDYQKKTLEQIRPQVVAEERKIIDDAIEMCSERRRWMRGMCNEGRSSPSDMHCPWR